MVDRYRLGEESKHWPDGAHTMLVLAADYDALEHEKAETERLLGELLAVIHRDGGHYQTTHGTRKAVEDAISIWYERLPD